ncbi:ABC transporter permease [Iodidimonas sp. MBR-55]|nr:ABC transporter permease [Iodidimonas sp. MBR-55]
MNTKYVLMFLMTTSFITIFSIILSIYGALKTIYIDQKYKIGIFTKNIFNNQILLFIQFIVIFFITITSIIHYDDYIRILKFDRGFDTSQIFRIDFDTKETVSEDILRNAVVNQSGLYLTSSSPSIPGKQESATPIGLGHIKTLEDLMFNASEISVAEHFDTVFDIDVIAGRWFSAERSLDFYKTDDQTGAIRSVVITRSTVEKLGLETPEKALGEIITFFDIASGLTPLRIIGVVDNLYFGDLNAERFYFFVMPDKFKSKSYYIKTDHSLDILGFKNTIVNRLPSFKDIEEISINTLKFHYDQMQSEKKNNIEIVIISTVMFMLVAVTGLFSMIYRSMIKSIKEICIRRLMGADVFSVTLFIIRKYIYNILLACTLGSFAAYAWNANWLNERIDSVHINITHFMTSYLIVLLSCISVFSVIYTIISNISVLKTLNINE